MQKKIRKTFISTVLWLLNDLLSLKTDVNVPTWSKYGNKKKIRETTNFFVGLLKAIEEKSRICNPVYGSEDPDLYPEKTYAASRIRTHWSCYFGFMKQNRDYFFTSPHLSINPQKSCFKNLNYYVWIFNNI